MIFILTVFLGVIILICIYIFCVDYHSIINLKGYYGNFFQMLKQKRNYKKEQKQKQVNPNNRLKRKDKIKQESYTKIQDS
ncbi:MAG: hypothetical protein ACOCP4_05430 [Candidatus Woesearchaeota archaeon]